MKCALIPLAVTLLVLPGLAAADTMKQADRTAMPASGDAAQSAAFGNDGSSAHRMPLYDAFRRFCLATGTQSEAIAKAVMLSRLPFHQRRAAATTEPVPMDMTGWDLDFEGHKLTLDAGHTVEPFGSAMLQKTTACTIFSWNNSEAASVAALHQWAGITRSPDSRQRRPTLYSFEVRGTAMIPLAEDETGRAAKAQGRAWLLVITQSANRASVALSHYLPPTLRP